MTSNKIHNYGQRSNIGWPLRLYLIGPTQSISVHHVSS